VQWTDGPVCPSFIAEAKAKLGMSRVDQRESWHYDAKVGAKIGVMIG